MTGPSGAAKTAAVQCIARQMGYNINEWISPTDVELPSANLNNDLYDVVEKQAETFSQFLFKSSRYCSVFESNTKRLVLVEDFPHVFLKDSTEFDSVLE